MFVGGNMLMLARLTLALKNNTSKHQSNQKVPLSPTEYSVSGLSEHVCVCVCAHSDLAGTVLRLVRTCPEPSALHNKSIQLTHPYGGSIRSGGVETSSGYKGIYSRCESERSKVKEAEIRI